MTEDALHRIQRSGYLISAMLQYCQARAYNEIDLNVFPDWSKDVLPVYEKKPHLNNLDSFGSHIMPSDFPHFYQSAYASNVDMKVVTKYANARCAPGANIYIAKIQLDKDNVAYISGNKKEADHVLKPAIPLKYVEFIGI